MVYPFFVVFVLAFGCCVEAAWFWRPSSDATLDENASQHIQSRQATTKYVFMHHMVGNTFNYDVNDWTLDIQQIATGGVDAVALNVGSDSWENGQLQNAYTAAAGNRVKLFLSFDFSSFACDIDSVVNTVNQFASSGSQFKINGRPVIGSFEGKCLGNAGWQQIKDRTGGYLMPFIEGIEGQFGDWTSLDSWLCWGCAWPQGNINKTVSNYRIVILTNFSPDINQLSQLNSVGYVATVSPWMFTHYDFKNFYQRGDEWLIAQRWEQMVEMRDNIAMVELATWNDFGESSYMGDIRGVQPAGTTWATGFPHVAWYELSNYYITAYKTGNYPAVTEDVIYFWARPHPALATASADPLPSPSGFNFAEDFLWALVFATQPAQVTLACGSSTQQFSVPTGVTKLKLPLAPGKITVSMTRSGKTIASQSPSDFTYGLQPVLYNYNAYVGSAKAVPGISASTTASVPTSSTSVTSPTSSTRSTSSTSATSSLPTCVPAATPQTVSWTFYGCVDEGTTGSRRALTGESYSGTGMTPEVCQTLCAKYSFAGVEFGQECYCGDSLTNNGATGVVTSPSQCSQPCVGDPSQICGAGWTLSVYTKNTTGAPQTH